MKTDCHGAMSGFDGFEGPLREESPIIRGGGSPNNTVCPLYRTLKTIKTAIAELPQEKLPALIGELEFLKALALVRLARPPVQTTTQIHDELIGVAEASRRLGLSRDYLYRHKGQFAFTRHQGRKLLFSAQGIERYIQQQPRTFSFSSRIEK
jgi:excisionase family DNA binding protein